MRFEPKNEQEQVGKEIILSFASAYSSTVLLRDSLIAHITSSGFVMNRELDKALLVHHNIRNVWAWTGGHADGDDDLFSVTEREVNEETGIFTIEPLSREIASLDIMPVASHW